MTLTHRNCTRNRPEGTLTANIQGSPRRTNMGDPLDPPPKDGHAGAKPRADKHCPGTVLAVVIGSRRKCLGLQVTVHLQRIARLRAATGGCRGIVGRWVVADAHTHWGKPE